MATYTANEMTSGTVVAVHAGTNSKIATYLQDETISAVGQINMCKVPKGAEYVGGKLLVQGVPGTGLAVKDNEGNILLHTATPTTQIALDFNGPGLGQRVTGSAHVCIEQNGLIAAQAGADSCTYTLIIDYLAEKSGD